MPPISGKKTGEGVQAVVLALNMLETIAASQRAVGVTELAQTFGTTKSRIHRHLQTLVAAGYLTQEPETERYRVSARLMSLGQAVSESHELTAAARPAMRELRDRFGHSVALSTPEADGMRIVGTLPGTSNVEMGVKPGSLLSLHASAQGKMALAFGDAALLRRLMQKPLPALTPRTIVDPLDLAADVKKARRRGWAIAPNEALLGLNAVAAPVFDALGHFAGAVAVVDSIQFIPAEPPAALIEAVKAAARRVSTDLGYRPKLGAAG
ncbi:MAG: IclR family transcriptional regulator [Methylobacteriaceae bacterium]|nr:IclR family transcriptional regulator [Methylobacteriaceae bacterium]